MNYEKVKTINEYYACRSLIGTVQLTGIGSVLVAYMCQSLIGSVQQPFLRTSTRILPCFSPIIKLFPSKNLSISNFSFFVKCFIFSTLRTFSLDWIFSAPQFIVNNISISPVLIFIKETGEWKVSNPLHSPVSYLYRKLMGTVPFNQIYLSIKKSITFWCIIPSLEKSNRSIESTYFG